MPTVAASSSNQGAARTWSSASSMACGPVFGSPTGWDLRQAGARSPKPALPTSCATPSTDTAGEFALAAHQTRPDPNFMRHHEAPEGYFVSGSAGAALDFPHAWLECAGRAAV